MALGARRRTCDWERFAYCESGGGGGVRTSSRSVNVQSVPSVPSVPSGPSGPSGQSGQSVQSMQSWSAPRRGR
eukprot:2944509-Prymnesium_polylepis.1